MTQEAGPGDGTARDADDKIVDGRVVDGLPVRERMLALLA